VDVSIALLIVLIVAAAIVGRMGIDSFKFPWLTAVACILLAACLAAQLNGFFPLSIMERDGSAIQEGQVYRLFTALWFQDGGIAGGAFNIAMLAVLGSLAEQVPTRPLWLGIYLIGGLLSEIVALAWQPLGAGNSVAYTSIAGALLGLALHRPSSRSSVIIAEVGLAAGLLLCLRRDIHGAGAVIGCALLLLAHVGSDKGKLRRLI